MPTPDIDKGCRLHIANAATGRDNRTLPSRIHPMRCLALLLALASSGANAVVIRDDVPDREHRAATSEFPALVDLPGEAHGVLIAPQWIVTAAHAVNGHPPPDVVVVGGTPRAVRSVTRHPGFRSPPQAMVEAALKSGDWSAFFSFLASSDDIALIELIEPVTDIAPVRIHEDPAPGQLVRIMGRGATGKGSEGHGLQAARRTDLRHGENQLTHSAGRWIGYRFDAPPDALPREASMGSGDSGGPILVAVGNEWRLAGVAAWKRGIVIGTDVFPGRYGETSYGVRLVHYRDWLAKVMAGGRTPPAQAETKETHP